MNIQQVIASGANVSVTVGAKDLNDFARSIAVQTRQEIEQEVAASKAETHVSPKRAADIFDVDPSTLHRWKVRGYLTPVEVGGKRRYKMSDINRILEGGRKL